MSSENEIIVEVTEVGVPETTVNVVVGLDTRPVIILEYFPGEPSLLNIGHGGWEGEIVDGPSLANILRETATILEHMTLAGEG